VEFILAVVVHRGSPGGLFLALGHDAFSPRLYSVTGLLSIGYVGGGY